jgi:hypothetical protein
VPLLVPLAASASSGEYGILEGRTVALLHPLLMFILLGATVYAVRELKPVCYQAVNHHKLLTSWAAIVLQGYLGFQWRRARELGEEIRSLKAAAASAATAEGGPAPNPEIEAKEKVRSQQTHQFDPTSISMFCWYQRVRPAAIACQRLLPEVLICGAPECHAQLEAHIGSACTQT